MTLKVEVAYNQAPDTASPTWTDVSDRVVQPARAGIGTRGFARFALKDLDGGLHPDVVGRVLMMPLKVTYDSHPLSYGMVKRWAPGWRYNVAVREVECIDALGWFAVRDIDADFDRQRSSERIEAILDAISWPAGLRDIATGGVMLEELERDSVNVRQLLEDVADAEDGTFHIDAEGKVRFATRHSRLNLTSSLDVFGTGQTGDVGAVDEVDTSYDTDNLYTICRVEKDDGTVREAISDATAQYGERELPLRDLSLPDYQAEALANWVVYRFATPEIWLPGLPVHTADAVADVLAIEPGDRVTLTHNTPDGSTETVSSYVEGVRHEVEQGRFVTTFDCSPYFGEGPWLTLDDATLGQIGTDNKIGP